jgi:hypothetical protein
MILEMHNTLENFFAFRMRARDEVAGVKKSKVLTLIYKDRDAVPTSLISPAIFAWRLYPTHRRCNIRQTLQYS